MQNKKRIRNDAVIFSSGVLSGNSFIKDFLYTNVSLNDIVYLSNISGVIERNIDNREIFPSIGIVIDKTASLCSVLLYGECQTVFSGLIKGKPVYLSDTGSLTSIRPTTGYVQIMGFSYDTDKIFVNPSLNRTKLNPF